MNKNYYIYLDQDGNFYRSDLHFLSAKELCIVFNLYTKDKNGRIHYPTRRLQSYLENRIKSYFYRPNLKSSFNQKKVYDIYSIPNIQELITEFCQKEGDK